MLRCALFALLLAAPVAPAAETPRDVWVKSKCALCHGLDGSGNTEAGRKVKTPDLRDPKIRMRDDATLGRSIAGGHRNMPSFRRKVSAKHVKLLIAYIRALK